MIKAYFVMRKDLNMSPAKLAVQVGHGTQYLIKLIGYDVFQEWSTLYDSRKIICEVSSEQKLINLADALRNKVPVCEIVDSGYTEFNGKTLTGISFIYDDSDKNLFVEQKIKRLQLYK